MGTRTSPVFLVVLASFVCVSASGSAAGQTVVFVDASATGAGNGSSWADAYTSVQPALDAATSGQEVWVAAGRYVGTITLAAGVGLYGGFAGIEDPVTFDLADRDFLANETILDGNQAGSVVTSPSGATATTRIDGFTITDGSAEFGGGLYLEDSSPTIANSTIIGNNASSSGSGLYLVRSSPTIADNVITSNGVARTWASGGGLYLSDSSPTIADNVIAGNTTLLDGGGLYVSGGAPTIENNTITDNSAMGPSSYGGGLLLCNSSPTIVNNIIARNRLTDSNCRDGGGLFLFQSSAVIMNNSITSNSSAGSSSSGGGLCLVSSAPTIVNNIIAGNLVYGDGGGLCLFDSSPTIANNMIAGNCVYDEGGGLYLSSSSPTIAGNTIAGNRAASGGGLDLNSSSPTIVNDTIMGNIASTMGGGLCLAGDSPTIANTIIAFNSSGVGRLGATGTPTLLHNCVYGNASYNYQGVTDPTGANGNISADPRLADLPYGNGHIQPDSPCMHAGTNGWAFGDYDRDGQPRIQPGDGTVDIGADESDGTAWPAGPYGIVRVSPTGDDGYDGSSWPLAKRTVQAGIDAASALGGEVWVQAGTYYERIMLHPYVYVYGGFSGNETEGDRRDWRANVTILDGQRQGSVVTALAGHGTVSVIDGFTITNGLASSGGGLCVDSTSPTIANNAITGNWAYVAGASNGGGGMYLRYSSATIVNNTITGNGAPNGGGLCLVGNSSSRPMMVNTIVAFNSSGIIRYAGGMPTLRHNCVYGNTGRNYVGIADPTWLNGNISADPQFVQNPDPGPDGAWGGGDDNLGDVHLLVDSPCIDAGSNRYVFGDFDVDGRQRIMDGRNYGAAIVDMGAYEYPADCNGNGVPDSDDIAQGTSSDCDGNGVPDECDRDCNSNGVPDGCDVAAGTGTDINSNGVLDECEGPGAPPAVVVGAVSRKGHAGAVGQVDIALNATGRVENHDLASESRTSGVAQLRIAFDVPPGKPGIAPILLEAQACPGGTPEDYEPYTDQWPSVAYVTGNELVVLLWSDLANARTYRLTLGPEISSQGGQRIEFRNLVGDANSDGQVDGTDRTTVIGIWTGSGFSPATDVNLDGRTNGTDRSVLIGAWTSAQNCAP